MFERGICNAEEALKKITGNDFGGDYEEWRRWYEKRK